MTTSAQAIERVREGVIEKKRLLDGRNFDWAMVAIGTWLMIGGYSDGWAHNHLPIDNFFTPWHAAFYSGMLATLVFLFANFVINRTRGFSWQDAMPGGYELSLLGVLIILFGGIGDMIWHILFGIELNIDGALSPTHIAVTIGLTLVVSGPFRAEWRRVREQSEINLLTFLPMLLSLTFALSAITIISQIFHPFVFIRASDPTESQATGVASIIIQAIILMGCVLWTVRRWQLPFGALTLVFTLNMVFLSFMQDHYVMILVAALAGLAADTLIWRWRPSLKRPDALHLFAFVVPIILYLLYFLCLQLTTGITWTIHLWLGSTFVAGIFGWLLSYLIAPPSIPTVVEQEEK